MSKFSLRGVVAIGAVVAASLAPAGIAHAGATNGTTTISGPSTLAVKTSGTFKVVLTCPTKITTGKIYLKDITDLMNPVLISAVLISSLTPASGFSGGFMYTATMTHSFTSIGTYLLNGSSAGTGTCVSEGSSPLTVKVTLGSITPGTLKPATTTTAASSSSGSSGGSSTVTSPASSTAPSPGSTTSGTANSSEGSSSAAGSTDSTMAAGTNDSGEQVITGEQAEGDESMEGAELKSDSDGDSDDGGSSSTGLIVGIVGLGVLAALFVVLAKKRKRDETSA